MECPVCLEPLSGTVVHLGCCNNQVHIQCYLPKCPLCRAELPLPRPVQPTHTIVPIPVTVIEQNEHISRQVLIANVFLGFALFVWGYAIFSIEKS